MMARQPIAAKVPTSKFPSFCRWAAMPGWRPPLRSIRMAWEQGMPTPFQRRRAQLRRMLDSPAFQQRSGSTLQHLCSAAGVDFDGIDPAVYPNLLSLWLEGPLPATTLLPPSLIHIHAQGWEATQDSPEEQLRLFTERMAAALPQLGPQLLQCPRLECVHLTHYHVDGLRQLLPQSVHRLGMLRCSITLQSAEGSYDEWLAEALTTKPAELSGYLAQCGEGVGWVDCIDQLVALASR
jgi:hypothetical protein